MAQKGRPKRIEASRETVDEYRLWSKSKRARFVDLFVKRATEALESSEKESPRSKMSLARQAAEVLDKLCGADLKELQREEILRRMAAGILGMGEESRPVINIVYPPDPAEPPAGGGTPGTPAGQ